MSSDVTIVVEGAHTPDGPDSASLHAAYCVGELQAELGQRLGRRVEVVHCMLGEAPRHGVLILFSSFFDKTISEVSPDTAARVIWMNATRKKLLERLVRYGLLGAVEIPRYFHWVKARANDRASGLYARAAVAGGLVGSSVMDVGVPGYVHLSDPRYRDLASLMGAYAAVANRQPPAAPDRPVEPPRVQEFPMGCLLDMGSAHGVYRIVRAVRGTPDRGMYEAQHVGVEGRAAYVSLGLRQAVALDRKRAELELPAEGFAPLLGIVRLKDKGTEFDAMLEGLPGGVPLIELQKGAISARRAARILLPVLGWVAAAHRQGRVVAGLRPELLFAALTRSFPDDQEYLLSWGTLRPVLKGVVPRCERFLVTAERPCYGVSPLFDTLYQAPEILSLRVPGPAADVFSLAAILAWLTLGAYPFPGSRLVDRMAAIMTGAWNRDEVPAELTSLLSAALAPDPDERPQLSAMEAQLAEIAA